MTSGPKVPIMSTAGAVTLKNEKGQLFTEKVKVSRYITGKRPDYAPNSSGDEEEEVVDLNALNKLRRGGDTSEDHETERRVEHDDRRVRRLLERRYNVPEEDDSDDDREARVRKHRELLEPEVLEADSDAEDMDVRVSGRRAAAESSDEQSDEEEEELDEEEIEKRRAVLRMRAMNTAKKEEDILDVEEEKMGSGEEEGEKSSSSEYEEYSGSEEEDHQPRLKPVFVRKRDRVTIQEKESEQKQRDMEQEKKRLANERRTQTLKMVEAEIRRENEELKKAVQGDGDDGPPSADENDEEAYEAWKAREMKRIKRDREEREKMDKEKHDVEKLHHMTEEERRQEQKLNPKVVTNRSAKGKYKFLQKYYHRGAFFLNEEDQIYTRDFTAPTLEDHFDKTVLPKVMQVKNFGRSGRTKYTHLVDQDTTSYESPWVADTQMNLKFHTTKGGGMKQVFERPAVKKRK